MTARAHGTHACYVHGPTGTADGSGCRCGPCRAANADYERNRAQRTAPPYVDAQPVREHIAWLSAHGVGLKTVARTSGVSHGALWKIVYGKPGRGPSKRVRPATRDAIIAVRPDQAADGALVPAAPTWAHVATLLSRGWTKAAISAAIGQDGRALQVGRRQVTRRTARAIAALLDEPVPDTPGTTRARIDVGQARRRGHQTAYDRRRRAEAHLPDQPTPDPDRLPLDPLIAASGLTPDALRRLLSIGGTTWTTYRLRGLPPATADRYATRLGFAAANIWPQTVDLPTVDVALDVPGAPCQRDDVPGWLFFPDPRDTETIAAAKAICAGCRHATRCADYATRNGEHGIWGGTTDQERAHTRTRGAA